MSLNILQNQLVLETTNYIHTYFEGERSGHDWWHIHRVRNLAKKIAVKEGGNLFLVEMAALLHDLDDWKLNHSTNKSRAENWLKKIQIEKPDLEKILEIIDQVSFKGAGVETHATSVEAKIVQDADRLDAIGAIGIARAFSYGGFKKRALYDPDIKPNLNMTKEEYKKSTAPTITHFYEKLLLLKDLMKTKSGKRIAEERHKFMLKFLDEFYKEWTGK